MPWVAPIPIPVPMTYKRDPKNDYLNTQHKLFMKTMENGANGPSSPYGGSTRGKNSTMQLRRSMVE